MRAFFFLSADFLRANLRQALAVLVWILSVGLALSSGTALWALPLYQPVKETQPHRLFFLALSPLLSETEITKLGWTIWAWPEITSVSFRFPGENDPEPFQERTLVVELAPTANREEVAQKLGKLPGVTKVTAYERVLTPPQVPSIARIAAIAAFVLSLGFCLFWGVRTAAKSQNLWREESALLRDSGLSPLHWRGPVFFFAGWVGLLGAGIYLCALWLGMRFIPPGSVWTQIYTLAPWATGLGIPAGVVLGELAALLSPHS